MIATAEPPIRTPLNVKAGDDQVDHSPAIRFD
jgi:hypothetical protein